MSTITDRLKELIPNQSQMASRIGISRQTLSGYCNNDEGGRKIPFEVAVEIAKETNVSLDWMGGIDGAIKSISPDVKAICSYTGLSEESVEVLHYINSLRMPKNARDISNTPNWNFSILKTVDMLLSSSLASINKNRNKKNNSTYMIDSIFTYIKKYLLSDHVKSADTKLEVITFDLKGAEDSILPSEIYQQYMANQIIKYLDSYKKEEKNGKH